MGVIDARQAGFATKASPLVSDLHAHDTKTLEPALQINGSFYAPAKKIPFRRYFDPDFAALEMEHMWKKCWQVVGREEDIPEVGDRMPYDCGLLSYIIIRSGPTSFRALQNACMHRGTRLCHGVSGGSVIKCPFHGWQWNLDGSLKSVTGRWDFPDVTDDAYHLPEAKIGRWGGFLFINPDPAAGPLQDALGVLPQHFTAREAEDRYTAVGFRKKLRANWKQAQEAFLEAYHLGETHAEFMTFNADTTTSYDTWDDGKSQVSRSITPAAVPSGHLGDDASRVFAARESLKAFASAMPGVAIPDISSAEDGRAEVAAWRRATMGPALGVDLSGTSDSYMVDSIQYFMFPNFFPWWGEGLPLLYQFMPYGSNPNECVMEARLTLPIPDSKIRPSAAELIELDFDTPVSSLPSMGLMATIFDQDFGNLPLVQDGLRATRDDTASVVLGRYQESRIQAFHHMLDRKLGL